MFVSAAPALLAAAFFKFLPEPQGQGVVTANQRSCPVDIVPLSIFFKNLERSIMALWRLLSLKRATKLTKPSFGARPSSLANRVKPSHSVWENPFSVRREIAAPDRTGAVLIR